MNEALWAEFNRLSNELSPENLCCDGELPPAAVRRKHKALMKEWAALEKKAGCKVSEDDVYRHLGWLK
jgi:hypothetical protein